MESAFDALYLVCVLVMGILILRKARGERQFVLFGAMAIVLGLGDAFHLVPCMIALLTDGLQNHVVSLGVGKLITSVTITVFLFCSTTFGGSGTIRAVRAARPRQFAHWPPFGFCCACFRKTGGSAQMRPSHGEFTATCRFLF